MRASLVFVLCFGAFACGGGAAMSGHDDASVVADLSEPPALDMSRPAFDLTTTDGTIDTPTNGPIAMPLLNRGVPVFASTGNDVFRDPKKACDEDQSSGWSTSDMPAWIAWDLSTVASAQRQDALVVWNAPHAGGFFLTPVQGYQQVPTAYTVEIHTAAGGGAPPTSGWQTLTTVADNTMGTQQHLVKLAGANWVRLAITAGTSEGVSIDVDVYSAPNGASDAWLFMGDSITAMTLTYAFSDLAARVHALDATRWPSVIDAAIGGTNTGTALDVIEATVAASPSRFVVFAYGTNDHANEYQMEALVQKVLALGRVPVVPHMPWSSGGAANGALINAQIDALYAKYPAIVPGPDLWALTYEHTEYIPTLDVHPTEAGRQAFRQAWAEMMATMSQQTAQQP